MAEKWRNPFLTCMAGLTVIPKSRSRDCTHVQSAEIVSPVTCMTGIHTEN